MSKSKEVKYRIAAVCSSCVVSLGWDRGELYVLNWFGNRPCCCTCAMDTLEN